MEGLSRRAWGLSGRGLSGRGLSGPGGRWIGRLGGDGGWGAAFRRGPIAGRPRARRVTDDPAAGPVPRAAGPHRRGVQPRSSSALVTTLTLLNAIAAPATTGLSRPDAASGMPTTL
jgi:hypothetical protein